MKPRSTILICCSLTALVLAVFGRTVTHDFVNFDDNGYVYDNPSIKAGLSLQGVRWAFTATRWGNWHPVTWLSHMLDAEMFGLRPGGHHLVNVLLHAGNAVLLFLVLRGLTGTLWRGGLVAALFAVHPLHVQSVAWVSERKDLLSTFLGLAALGLYLGYARRPSQGRYFAVASVFTLGLMAKPMLVTLPVLLLLLDWWPLGRVPRVSAKTLLREKAPLLALSAIFGVVSVLAQRSIGALMGTDSYPVAVRAANAIVSVGGYFWKAIIPTNLAVFYPHPRGGPEPWVTALALALLVTVTTIAATTARRRPHLVVGWLWYLVTLLPVIGLVQVGHQAMADRYTYVPLIGPFLMLSWTLAHAARHLPSGRAGIICVAVSALAMLSALSWQEAGYWKNSESLMRRALAVTTDNFTAHNNLGTALLTQRRYDEAIPHFREVLRIRPDHFNAHLNLGQILELKGQIQEAVSLCRAAVQLDPESPDARRLLGLAEARLGASGGMRGR